MYITYNITNCKFVKCYLTFNMYIICCTTNYLIMMYGMQYVKFLLRYNGIYQYVIISALHNVKSYIRICYEIQHIEYHTI